jgi:hypothetical protein
MEISMSQVLKVMLSILVVSGSNPPANAAEETPPQLYLGHYISYMGFEPEWSIELYLAKDGSATYTIFTREAGASPSTKKSESFRGRWNRKADVLTVSLSEGAADSTVEYKIASCLSYVSNTSVHCSLGLEPVETTMTSPFSQQFWYVVVPGGHRSK